MLGIHVSEDLETFSVGLPFLFQRTNTRIFFDPVPFEYLLKLREAGVKVILGNRETNPSIHSWGRPLCRGAKDLEL